MQKKIIHYFNIFLLILTLNACNYLDVYRPEIKQGNVLDSRQINQLKLGMSKQIVTDILGSPVINDIFHNDNWVYVNSSTTQNYRLELIFNNNKLQQIIPHNLSTIKK